MALSCLEFAFYSDALAECQVFMKLGMNIKPAE
jgi:hypothetical protein